ncbi:hypothetical protein CCR75_007757 [Bremia lactucae]|uniref:Bromo domain-containing protein n=1 Tax=Bremia lactucae TaxID=4779 RepID=A0A976FET1_BRELC|nr:hypothetical protein CCR75_007757 [Bremia lactucae]
MDVLMILESIDRMQDWKKTLARKLQDNWRKVFSANPMGGGVTYAELTVLERVKILHALCHWKLDTCAEIHKHIAMLQKDNDNDAIEHLRAGEIGIDDEGVSYWYFNDGCWIYAEDKPQWQLKERKSSYSVEFASGKRIRLSIDFDTEHNSLAPPLPISVKSVFFADKVNEGKTTKDAPIASYLESTRENGVLLREKSKTETDSAAADSVKVQYKEPIDGYICSRKSVVFIREDLSHDAPSRSTSQVETKKIVLSGIPLKEEKKSAQVGQPHAGETQFDEFGQALDIKHKNELKGQVSKFATAIASPRSLSTLKEGLSLCAEGGKVYMGLNKNFSALKSSETDSPVKVSKVNVSEQNHPNEVAVVGSKKRTIVDDDRSDSSSSDVDTLEESLRTMVGNQAIISPPRPKRRKAILQTTNIGNAKSTEAIDGNLSLQVNKAAISQISYFGAEANFYLASTEKDGVTTLNTEKRKSTENLEELPGPSSSSSTELAVPLDSFDITCESCKKCYDMRYVDPPLMERPTEEWRCFECLVNDARGWPRRRKSTHRMPLSPHGDNFLSQSRSFSSKHQSESLQTSSKYFRNSCPSSSFKKNSSHTSTYRRIDSKSKNNYSKKSSSAKKQKKRKSSSSSHNHHKSHGRRRRHHSHYCQAEFAKLLALFRERQHQRINIEEARVNKNYREASDEAPQGWRVASSTLDNLRALIKALFGGSLEQDRLRGRLILILKDQEKTDELRRKQQELAWNILPRRQSSRIAIGKMKSQSAQESETEERYSDEDVEARRPGLRSRRPRLATSDFIGNKRRHDRAWRAQRRHNHSENEASVEIEVDMAGNWIDWSFVKSNARSLSMVCLAIVDRLLKEEAALPCSQNLFSRPVNPELDGCPNYLSIITQPIDLGTIRLRADKSVYRKWEFFKKDVELVWKNCRLFNAPDTAVVQFANALSKLFRSMCNAAEKEGVDFMKDRPIGDESDSDDRLSDVSKVESRGSINKGWSESSASENSESSDSNLSSVGDSECDTLSCEQQSVRATSKNSRYRSLTNEQISCSRLSGQLPASTPSSKNECLALENEKVHSDEPKSRQLPQISTMSLKGECDPTTEIEKFGGGTNSNEYAAQPQNDIPSLYRQLPAKHMSQRRLKPRLVISDTSSSEESSDSGNYSSSSSSADPNGSESDRCMSKHLLPPPPSATEAAIPPPPLPPPPYRSPGKNKSAALSLSRTRTGACHEMETTLLISAKPGESSSVTHFPPLLNSYLSPSSSSSSEVSSGESDSSEGDSCSD